MFDYSQVADEIVKNNQYRNIVDEIIAQGGDLSSLIAAVNKHRYKVSDRELTSNNYRRRNDQVRT